MQTNQDTPSIDSDVIVSSRLGPEHEHESVSHTSDIPGTRKPRMRASLACEACRFRHMKCDAIKPKCSRCQFEKKQCIYGTSRRGGKRKLDADAGSSGQSGSESMGLVATSNSSGINKPFNDSLPMAASNTAESEATIISQAGRSEPETSTQALDLYFENFHCAHPFILPRFYLESRIQSGGACLHHLVPVMEFVGSIYEPDWNSEAFRQVAHDTLSHLDDLPENGFTIQALLLFAIALHCSDEYNTADHFLDQALDMALSLQMNLQDFATRNGEGSRILEESWRRTYWTLFLMDGLFAVINHRTTHRLQKVISSVDLPCEDKEYHTGQIPSPRSIQDYDNREFELDDVVFSSLSYLIDVGRIISNILGVNRRIKSSDDPCFLSADAQTTNWLLHLPEGKTSVIGEQHTLDEPLFLAHLLYNTEKLLLHRLHSQLRYSPIEMESACTPPYAQHGAMSSRWAANHTAKSLEAIEAVGRLLSVSSLHIRHSPIFICALALVTMSQVSACNNVLENGSQKYMAYREQIRLSLGVLRGHEQRWETAKRSVREVKRVARHLLSIPSSTQEPLFSTTLMSQDTASGYDPMTYVMGDSILDFGPGEFDFGDFGATL
ncbi:hypothetical protein FH972_025556 [Carpinus fangiana]|uniref:Zn(2)-C6 fungal-type domain-containing protein n=1 Tax=Carpinus fangiana TaxID=176857 RepID=A0A5N6L3Y4_9ROSI|nr:hypothetical protein FH972_025556 [Carpinus fangiana]